MRRRDLLIRAGLVAGGVAGAWWLRDHVLWRAPDLAFSAGGAGEWLAYAEPRALTPTVEVRVNGSLVVRALIDSGAQYSVVDRSLADRLGLEDGFAIPMIAYGVGGQPQVGQGVVLDVRLGSLRLSSLRAAVLSLGPLASPQGLDAPLILGQDVLQKLIFEVDAPERRMRFLSRSDWRAGADLRPIEVKKAGKALQTTVSLEAGSVEAVVDTGASALLAVTDETAREVGLMDGRPRSAGRSIVLGGVVSAETVVARTLTVGDRLYRDAEVAVYANVPAPGFPKALVGMAAFEGGRTVLDLGGPGLFVSRPLEITVAG